MTEISTTQLHRQLENAQHLAEAKNDMITTLKRKNTVLTKELEKLTGGVLTSDDAEAIFRHWVSATGRDPKRVVFGDKRQQVVKARLREYDAEQIKRAIGAVATHPYVVNSRRATTGPEDQRYDELELICRNEVNMDKFIKLADRIEEEGKAAWERAVRATIKTNGRNLDDPSKPRLYGEGFANFVAALHRVGIDVPDTPPSGQYQTRCPAHDDRSPSLRWKEAGDGRILIDCKAGCETAAVLEALGLDFSDIGPSDWPSVEQRRVVGEQRAA